MPDTVWYWLTFIFVLFVLAIYGAKRFNEVNFNLDKNLDVLLSGLRVAEISTNTQWLRGFSFYFFSYAFVFAALCICQPLAAWTYNSLTGKDLSSAWASPAGPLLVASLLVGVMPSVPMVAQFELFIRTVSQRIAGIPDEILDLLDDVLQQVQLSNIDSISDPKLKAEILELDMIGRLIGLDEDERTSMRVFVVRAKTLGPWVHSNLPQSIWSIEVLDRLKRPRALAASESEQNDVDRDILLQDWKRFFEPDLDTLLGGTPSSFSALAAQPEKISDPSVNSVVNLFQEKNDGALSDFGKRWKHYRDSTEILSQHCFALFSLLFYSDEHPRTNVAPAYLREAMNGLRRQSLSFLMDPVLFAAVLGFLTCLGGISAIRIAKSILRDEHVKPGTLLETAINLGLSNGAALLFWFTAPVIIAILFRYAAKERRESGPLFKENEPFPILKITQITLVTFSASVMVQVVYYLGVQLVAVSGVNYRSEIARIFIRFFTVDIFQQIALSVVGCILAIAVCHILDKHVYKLESDQHVSRTPVISFIIFSLTTIFTLLLVFFIVQLKFHVPGYFDERVFDDGFKISWFDNLATDSLAITIFLTFFLYGIYSQARFIKAK